MHPVPINAPGQSLDGILASADAALKAGDLAEAARLIEVVYAYLDRAEVRLN